MNKLTLENGMNYIVVINYKYNNQTYLYLINENNENDIQIAELTQTNTLKIISDPELLKNIINGMVSHIYRFFD